MCDIRDTKWLPQGLEPLVKLAAKPAPTVAKPRVKPSITSAAKPKVETKAPKTGKALAPKNGNDSAPTTGNTAAPETGVKCHASHSKNN